MQFTNSFEVGLPPEKAWPFLLDIERVAPCMPGAELTEVVDARSYKGKVSVRLGPVSLAFAGLATFEEIDDATHTAKVKAQGTDSKGRGGANAVVVFHLEPVPAGTKVIIDTDLNLSGSVAQYGRGAGMIQSVANQLISQFAKQLEGQIAHLKEVEAIAAPAPVAAEAGQEPAAQAAAPASTAQASLTPASLTPAAPTPVAPRPMPAPAKPISGFSLVFGALWATVRGWFTRKG